MTNSATLTPPPPPPTAAAPPTPTVAHSLATLPQTRKKNRQSIKRSDLRDQLWPGCHDKFWDRTNNNGFTTVPRLLPLIMTLMGKLSGKLDPSKVYFELWARVFDEGVVTITSPLDVAYAAGYTGKRAERTLNERLLRLHELGFINGKPDGNREWVHILIVNPLQAAVDLHAQGRVPAEWWSAFVRRAGEVGATLPPPTATTATTT